MRDHVTEIELRKLAIAGSKESAIVLADFYEERGQPSRARLWRARAVIAVTHWANIPDLLTPDVGPYGKCDPRRTSMIGLLSRVMRPTAIARAFDLSPGNIRQIITRQNERVRYNASYEIDKAQRTACGMPAVRRLVAARALTTPGRIPGMDSGCNSLLPYAFGDVPPETWPATRPHEVERLANHKEGES